MNKTSPIFLSAICLLVALTALTVCDDDHNANNDEDDKYSGTWCIDEQNIEMVIDQSGEAVTFSVMADREITGRGTVSGDTLILNSAFSATDSLTIVLLVAADGKNFTGTLQMTDSTGAVIGVQPLAGSKGKCPVYDIDVQGVPKLVRRDFTELNKIQRISRFRSASGHSYTDRFETCRSMKHYYSAKPEFRKNNTIKIHSPVDGIIVSVSNDGHGASIGLNNKQIRIKPLNQPAIVFRIFHTDMVSSEHTKSYRVQSGELLGYGRLYYDDLPEYADSFDIAVEVNTPAGLRLVSYFETLDDLAFDGYRARGAAAREDFIITKALRDADPLQCDGERFITEGTIDNWVLLN